MKEKWYFLENIVIIAFLFIPITTFTVHADTENLIHEVAVENYQVWDDGMTEWENARLSYEE
ncbi:MAG: hypothetical protein K6E91_04925 [Butyrivibrio sp.]|nr:hypothetical protein [Butyrivibrio sp.]